MSQFFEGLLVKCEGLPPMPTAVAHPCDAVSLCGAVDAAKEGLLELILVGPERKIRAVAEAEGIDLTPYSLIPTKHSHEAAEKAVALVRDGTASVLMKGSLHTDEVMHEVMQKETGLRTGRRVSHVYVMHVPTYHKLLMVTDAAINIYPTLEEKQDICQNAIDLAQALGIGTPKIGILSAVETVTPKLPSTVEAAALCKMAERGQITGGMLDGPLAFDNAINKEAAEIKHIHSDVAGDVDILLAPDLEAGNMLAKQLTFLANADAAGLVVGARAPIILTSRADSVPARLASCAVAAIFAAARQGILDAAAREE